VVVRPLTGIETMLLDLDGTLYVDTHLDLDKRLCQ
jgi:hypothetical protein